MFDNISHPAVVSTMLYNSKYNSRAQLPMKDQKEATSQETTPKTIFLKLLFRNKLLHTKPPPRPFFWNSCSERSYFKWNHPQAHFSETLVHIYFYVNGSHTRHNLSARPFSHAFGGGLLMRGFPVPASQLTRVNHQDPKRTLQTLPSSDFPLEVMSA